jgi:putative spermidine/putrescine transport system ATP-binding protein
MASGEWLQARAINIAGVGARTTVSFRPEKIDVGGPQELHANRLHGKVLEAIYHGDHCRLRVAVAGSDEFMVKMRFRDERPPPSAGETLELGFHAQDCLALDPVK